MMCGGLYEFLTTSHVRATHGDDGYDTVDDYRDWVAETWTLPPDDPVLESGELTRGDRWQENRHRFEDWRQHRSK